MARTSASSISSAISSFSGFSSSEDSSCGSMLESSTATCIGDWFVSSILVVVTS